MKRIGITLGDQAGIGPEIISKALKSKQWDPSYEFQIIGQTIKAQPGKPNMETAQASMDALEEGADKLKSGEIDAIVTAPVAKEWLHKTGFTYPGQTEFFADRLHCNDFAMCLTGQHLTVALVTIHIALHEVPKALQKEEIIRIGKLLHQFCEQKHQRAPKIAVCGLNPHAGENGAFGSEDINLVTPAIQELNAQLSGFTGPHPPDTIFRPAADGQYDAVLCMYHDQGLIPLKLLDFDSGVNITLGLPRPRTSPDHGTAYNIAGKNVADPRSMIHAIDLACKLS